MSITIARTWTVMSYFFAALCARRKRLAVAVMNVRSPQGVAPLRKQSGQSHFESGITIQRIRR